MEALELSASTPEILPPPGTTDPSSIDMGNGESAKREIKEWQAIMEHLMNLSVANQGDLPVIPVDARADEVRAIREG